MTDLPIIQPPTSCDGCGGSCCREMRSPPFIAYIVDERRLIWKAYEGGKGSDDIKWRMSAPKEARRVYLRQLKSDAPDDSPCSWLDLKTGRCRWYRFRPEICRDFEIGSEGCLRHRCNHGVK